MNQKKNNYVIYKWLFKAACFGDSFFVVVSKTKIKIKNFPNFTMSFKLIIVAVGVLPKIFLAATLSTTSIDNSSSSMIQFLFIF
jgi:hypothetical protein